MSEYTTELVVGPPRPYASLWLDKPMLGDVSNQTYHGRVVIEIWEKEALMFHTSYPNERGKTVFVLNRARLALQDSNINTPALTTPPRPDEPLTGELPGQFLGRVVIEVWDSQVIASITGLGQRSDLVSRAIQELYRVMNAIELSPFPTASS